MSGTDKGTKIRGGQAHSLWRHLCHIGQCACIPCPAPLTTVPVLSPAVAILQPLCPLHPTSASACLPAHGPARTPALPARHCQEQVHVARPRSSAGSCWAVATSHEQPRVATWASGRHGLPVAGALHSPPLQALSAACEAADPALSALTRPGLQVAHRGPDCAAAAGLAHAGHALPVLRLLRCPHLWVPRGTPPVFRLPWRCGSLRGQQQAVAHGRRPAHFPRHPGGRCAGCACVLQAHARVCTCAWQQACSCMLPSCLRLQVHACAAHVVQAGSTRRPKLHS